jgi:hypothetical protein
MSDDVLSFEEAAKKKGKKVKSNLHSLPSSQTKSLASLEADFNEKFNKILAHIEQIIADTQLNRDCIQELIKRLRNSNIKI